MADGPIKGSVGEQIYNEWLSRTPNEPSRTHYGEKYPGMRFRNINSLVSGYAGNENEPVLNALVSYLHARGALPLVDAGYMGGGRYYGDRGEAMVEFGSKNILAHELMHAADTAMQAQYRPRILKPLTQFEKMHFSLRPDAKAFNSDWAEANKTYRASPRELRAWAIGQAAQKGSDTYNPPLHLDPTLATEQMLLLEAATREAYKAQEDEVEAEARSRKPKTLMQKVFGR